MSRLVAAVLFVTAFVAGHPAALPASVFQATAAQNPAPPPRPTGVATGRVLDVETGRPVPGAVVTLMGAERPRATQADADGRFRFTEVPRGAMLFATRRGYLDWASSRRPWDPGGRLFLRDGDTRADVVLYLIKEAVISGRVVDESGDPVVGFEMTVLSRTYVAGRPVFQRVEPPRESPRTDDRGMYRIAGLLPGEYLVVAENAESSIPEAALGRLDKAQPDDPLHTAIYSVSEIIAQQGGWRAGSGQTMTTGGYARVIGRGPVAPPGPDGRFRSYPTTYHPDVTLGSAARPIAVRPGEERAGIDVQLRPVTTVRVSGIVNGPRGALSDLPLFLVPGTSEDWLDELPVARTLSDERGAFIFPGVPPGQYRVHVLKTPAPPRDTDSFEFRAMETSGTEVVVDSGTGRSLSTPLSDPAAADMVWSSTAISVGEADLAGVTVEALAGARISGRVVLSATDDKAKAALKEGLTIVFERADGHGMKITQSPNPFRAAGWTMSEPDGTFHTRPLPPGRYLARVDSNTWSLKSAMLGSRNVADVPVEVRAQDIDNVILALTNTPSVLSGIVRAAAGTRLDGLAVLAFPVDRAGWSDFGITPRRIRTAAVKADGQYELTGLPAGEYYVSVVDDAIGLERVSTSRLAALAGTATRATIGEGERKRLELQASSRR